MPAAAFQTCLLWDEQEYGDSPKVRILKVMDRLLPRWIEPAKRRPTPGVMPGAQNKCWQCMKENFISLDARVYAWMGRRWRLRWRWLVD